MSNPTLGTEHRQAIFRQYINLCFTYIKIAACCAAFLLLYHLIKVCRETKGGPKDDQISTSFSLMD